MDRSVKKPLIESLMDRVVKRHALSYADSHCLLSLCRLIVILSAHKSANFFQYDKKVLHLVTRLFTRFRLRKMNETAKKKRNKKNSKNDKKKKKSPITLRGKKQVARFSMNN